MGVVVPDKPQKIKILNHGRYDPGRYDRVHVAGRGYVKSNVVLKMISIKLEQYI